MVRKIRKTGYRVPLLFFPLLLFLASTISQTSSSTPHQYECTEEKHGYLFCWTDAEGIEYLVHCDWANRRGGRFLYHNTCIQPTTKCYQDHVPGEVGRAWCTEPTPRPKFPSVDTLSWNGTKIYDDRPLNGRNRRLANEYGYASQDKAGKYFKTTTTVCKWGPVGGPHIMRTSFEYITPRKDGGQNRYVGFHTPELRRKRCTKEVRPNITWRNNLQREWDDWFKYTYDLKLRRSIDANTEEQIWEREMIYEEGEVFTSWNITYFRKEGFAIPNTKYHEDNSDDGLKVVVRLNFAYDRYVGTMNVKVPAYCK